MSSSNQHPASTTHKAKQTKHVLVIDSGVGGLSVLLAIADKAPEINLHYVSDNAAFPYGEKSESFLVQRISQLVNKALEAHKADIIVIACNTASTVVLPSLREQTSLPIVGVVPAIKTAAQQSQSRVIGLLATPGTVNRRYTQQLIDEHAADCKVVSVGSGQLVEMTENYLCSGEIEQKALTAILEQFDHEPHSAQIDTLVLGCTHFPLIADHIQELRAQWQLVDSGEAIARRVCNLLGLDETHAKNSKEANGKRYIHFTDLAIETTELDRFLLQRNFEYPAELMLDQ